MIYRLNCSSGNTVGVDEHISCSEIDKGGAWYRYPEVRADDKTLRYSTLHLEDRWGMLPDGVFVESVAVHSQFGVNVPISKELFESAWLSARCINDRV